MLNESSQMAMNSEKILFIDDSKAQLQLYKVQTEDLYKVSLANDYQEAIYNLSTNTPDLIVLDMVMPQVTGIEFLDILRNSPTFKDIPVIIVSGDQNIESVREAFTKGASDYVKKPYDTEELKLRIHRLLNMKPRVMSPESTITIQQKNAKLLMIKSLSDLSATRDNETGNHLNRIEKYVKFLTIKAAESTKFKSKINRFFLETIAEVSSLHDIGKVGIPDHILQKPGPLDSAEFEIMKTHTILGSETLKQIIKSFPSYDFLVIAEEIARTHHERFDGKGYPAGISDENIPLAGRIVSVADVFDALTTKRVYKPAFAVEKAVSIMKEGRGTQFDPNVIDIFLENITEITAIHEKFKDRD